MSGICPITRQVSRQVTLRPAAVGFLEEFRRKQNLPSFSAAAEAAVTVIFNSCSEQLFQPTFPVST